MFDIANIEPLKIANIKYGAFWIMFPAAIVDVMTWRINAAMYWAVRGALSLGAGILKISR